MHISMLLLCHRKHGCRAGFLLSPHFCGERTSKDGIGSYSLLNALHTPTDNLDCSLILKTNSKKACSTLFLLFRLLMWASIWDYKNALVWTTELINFFAKHEALQQYVRLTRPSTLNVTIHTIFTDLIMRSRYVGSHYL